MSSFYVEKYARSKFMVIETQNTDTYIDFFSDKSIKMVQNLQRHSLHTFTAGQKLTKISYDYYGTTTLWWVILVYNGFFHPLEVPYGIVLLIPYIADIDEELLSTNDKLNFIGQLISI